MLTERDWRRICNEEGEARGARERQDGGGREHRWDTGDGGGRRNRLCVGVGGAPALPPSLASPAAAQDGRWRTLVIGDVFSLARPQMNYQNEEERTIRGTEELDLNVAEGIRPNWGFMGRIS